MRAGEPLAHHTTAELRPDPARVIARLFLPGEELPNGRSRAAAVVARILALPEAEVAELAGDLLTEYDDRLPHYREMLLTHASTVGSRVRTKRVMSTERRLLVGASFTSEYAVEGAALCNPSAVRHPDQGRLDPDQVRVAISLRAIGEGHVSSIGFATAIVGPGASWVFEPRQFPASEGHRTVARWQREHLRAVVADQGPVDELAHSVLADLPSEFTGPDLERAIEGAYRDLLMRSGAQATLTVLRQLVDSAYGVTFDADIELSQQVLLPSAAEESNGMEDARFVRFVGDDATIDYRATYTAYDGRRIAPRILTSPDLRTFRAHRLAGPAARNKGMALFPRPIGGQHVALCRSDGERTGVTISPDGLVWAAPSVIQEPVESWELLQIGNCGAPIETDEGWLVLTHGVGPMRRYSIGAILLDLDEPTRVLRRLRRPLLQARPDEREGYVPDVVYSCGGVVHDGRLWLPYGIGDARIGVAWVFVEELLATMTTT